MNCSIAMTKSLNDKLQNFLLHDKTKEEICFAMWKPSVGSLRYSALLHDAIFPDKNDRKKYDETISASPSYVGRCEELARENNSGLAMIHTHPFGFGHQDVSLPDIYYEQDILAREVFGITGLPFVGMTLAGDRIWSGRIYPKPFKIKWCSKIRIVGENLTVDFNPEFDLYAKPNRKQIRTTSVWGHEKQRDIMRLNIGIIGAGSVGTAVGEILARLGSSRIFLMDYDTIKIHNLDRMIGVNNSDIGKMKKNVMQKNMSKSATSEGFSCVTSNRSIVEEDGYKEALDCDVIFCCVDRPWPRHILNHISYSSLIPVIDGGVSFRSSDGKLVHGMYRAQTVGPERACLDCSGALNMSEVQMDRDGNFDNPAYIEKQENLGEKTRQNIIPFSFGLASLESIQFIEMVTNLANVGNFGQQAYDYCPGEILPKHHKCKDSCEYQRLVAKGDTVKPVLGADKSRKRDARNARNDLLHRIRQILGKFSVNRDQIKSSTCST